MHFSPLRQYPVKNTSFGLVLVEGEIEPAANGTKLLIAPYHVHNNDDEVFYVTAGAIAFEIGDEEFVATAGDAVVVQAGKVHTWWNAGSEPARYLIAMPKILDDLINAIHQEPRSHEDWGPLYAQFDSTYVGWTR